MREEKDVVTPSGCMYYKLPQGRRLLDCHAIHFYHTSLSHPVGNRYRRLGGMRRSQHDVQEGISSQHIHIIKIYWTSSLARASWTGIRRCSGSDNSTNHVSSHCLNSLHRSLFCIFWGAFSLYCDRTVEKRQERWQKGMSGFKPWTLHYSIRDACFTKARSAPHNFSISLWQTTHPPFSWPDPH